jgi:hypothetical protein
MKIDNQISGGEMKKIFGIIVLALLLVSCSPSQEQIEAAIVQTQEALPTNTQTFTDVPTNTATITNTPEPTNTPRPTNTPKPSATPTPLPEPITLTGNTDSVVDIDKWSGPALVKISYTGGGNFAVINYGENNERYELLVNTIGNYEGTLPLDFLDDQQTKRFEVTASGPWEITILDLTEIRREKIPGTIIGSGDDVVYLDGENPDLMNADGTNAIGNFAIWGYGNGRDLLVNEIAPYSGTVMLDPEIFLLVIKEGGGEWSLEITTN